VTLPETLRSEEVSGAMGRKLHEKVQTRKQRTKNLRRCGANKKKHHPDREQPRKGKETSSPSRKEHA